MIKDRISAKLNVAFSSNENSKEESTASNKKEITPESTIETTADELQAFMIVRAISLQVIDMERVTMRDSKSYCAVFADNNNRKPICRFYFNSKKTYQLGIFDAERKEIRYKIQKLSEIFDYATQISEAAKRYT